MKTEKRNRSINESYARNIIHWLDHVQESRQQDKEFYQEWKSTFKKIK